MIYKKVSFRDVIVAELGRQGKSRAWLHRQISMSFPEETHSMTHYLDFLRGSISNCPCSMLEKCLAVLQLKITPSESQTPQTAQTADRRRGSFVFNGKR
jgi:hypothetical protein